MENYDLICIGAGSGGIAAARKAAEFGKKIAVIEKHKLGGTCVNVGCVPKKLFYYAAETAEKLHSAKNYGFEFSGKFDWQNFKIIRDEYISNLNAIYKRNLENANVDLFFGQASFLSANTVKIKSKEGEKIISANHIIIATGSSPKIPEIKGREYAINSDDFFALTELPEKIIIAGGGYIACEIAGILNALGSEVDLIVRGSRILRNFDRDIIANQQETMQNSGINIHFQEEIKEVRKDGENIIAIFKSGSAKTVNQLLFATGREANISELDLDKAGVIVNPQKNIIEVDEFQNTNIKNIYAIGDVIGKADLTPVAIAAGRKLARRLFNSEQNLKLDYQNIPTVIFTHPPIASIGLSEEEAITLYGQENISVYQTKFNPMSRKFALLPAKFMVKLICLGAEEKIIGLIINGDGADEILQGFAVAIKMGATKKDFDDTIAIHPTAAEEIVTLK
ncbi:MAG: glutathione-disulfide reductase [Cardiobacteriaceae bacterium]|nr:glutathione-disulfide reductase [Cardiobacteriaceae bacterium]